ncbi:spermidine synthase [Shewanella marina]|uniref:spermidine synthase n=1 Tax=Shewanella marina TaxID=487319 RepID=UPI000471572F|nr:methyltransferase [Shewanella marina]
MTDYQTIYQTQDALGELTVYEDKQHRILSFGDNDEQTKLLKATPFIPQHTYVQAMLLVLLFCKPKRAIILGLGGGSLIHALRHFDAAIKLTAVELRADVIDIAKRYFQLPLSKKLTLVEQDAISYIASTDHKKVDVIFADIYIEAGIDQAQLSAEFINNCSKLIKADGYLVLNCWKEHKFDRHLLEHLQHQFADVRACLTGSGNWVVLAGKTAKSITAAGLKNSAADLSQSLGFQLGRSLTRFETWE